jgi:hypothetical protein
MHLHKMCIQSSTNWLSSAKDFVRVTWCRPRTDLLHILLAHPNRNAIQADENRIRFFFIHKRVAASVDNGRSAAVVYTCSSLRGTSTQYHRWLCQNEFDLLSLDNFISWRALSRYSTAAGQINVLQQLRRSIRTCCVGITAPLSSCNAIGATITLLNACYCRSVDVADREVSTRPSLPTQLCITRDCSHCARARGAFCRGARVAKRRRARARQNARHAAQRRETSRVLGEQSQQQIEAMPHINMRQNGFLTGWRYSRPLNART